MIRFFRTIGAGLALALVMTAAAGADEASLVRPSETGFVFLVPYDSKGSTVFTYAELPKPAGPDGKIDTRVVLVPPADYAVRGMTRLILVSNQSFDCKARTFRVAKAEFYDEKTTLAFVLPYDDAWQAVQPNSAAESTLQVVCGEVSGMTVLPDIAAVRADALIRRSEAK